MADCILRRRSNKHAAGWLALALATAGVCAPAGQPHNSKAKNAAKRAEASAAGTAATPSPAAASSASAKVTAVRFWSLGDVTRVAVEVDSEFKFKSEKLPNPDRLFFDIEGAKPALSDQRTVTIPVGDGLLKQIRVAETQPGVTRVVLDLENPVSENTSQLLNPGRLIIELKRGDGKPSDSKSSEAKLKDPKPEDPRTDDPQAGANPAPPAVSVSGGRTLIEPLTEPHRLSAESDAASSRSATQTVTTRVSPRKFVAPPPHPLAVRETPKPPVPMISTMPPPLAMPAKPAVFVASGKLTLPPFDPGFASAGPTPAGPIASGQGRDSFASAIPAGISIAAKPSLTRTLPAVPEAGDPLPAKRGSDGDRSLTRILGLKLGRVVLDPGHGGHDMGTHGPSGLSEKDVVLDVAQRLGALIEARLGSEVIYTREDDTFVPLEERTALANQHKADLFLSIHANSSPYRSAAGVETYILNFTTSKTALDVAARENASSARSVFDLKDALAKIALKDKIDESREFASHLQTALWSISAKTNTAARDRGVKKAPFVVLIGAQMPSVLAEIGFLTNAGDEALLRKPEQREKIAEALYKGIAAYADSLSHFQVARRE